MKKGSIFLIIVFWFLILLLLPFITVLLNKKLNFANYNFIYLFYIGIFILIMGIMLLILSLYLLINAGKGTPLPLDPPKKFVASGIYKYTRNPMVLGYLLTVLGEYLLIGNTLLGIYVLLLFHLYIVLIEEPELEKRFGDKYLLYKKRVPRWFPVRIKTK